METYQGETLSPKRALIDDDGTQIKSFDDIGGLSITFVNRFGKKTISKSTNTKDFTIDENGLFCCKFTNEETSSLAEIVDIEIKFIDKDGNVSIDKREAFQALNNEIKDIK